MNGFISYLRSVYMVKRTFEDKDYTIKVPQKTKEAKNALLMQALPMIISIGTMLLFVLGYNMIKSIASGDNSGSVLGSMGMYFVFMGASVVSGIITSRIQKRDRDKEENAQIIEWEKRLRTKEESVSSEFMERSDYLKRCYYLTQDQLLNSVETQSAYLWNVMESHNDFLTESLGAADVESGIHVAVDGEVDHLDSSLLGRVRRFEESFTYIHDAPFCINLKENPCIGVYGEHSTAFVSSFISKICVRHGYDILKCALICNSENCNEFSWMRWLPHIWDDVKCYRYILKDARQTPYFESFENIIKSEVKKMQDGYYLPFYIFIVAEDNYIYGEKLIKSILDLVGKNRAALISIGKRQQDIPSFCTARIDATKSTLIYYDSKYPEGKGKKFKTTPISEMVSEKVARGMSRLSLVDHSADTRIPTKIGFFDLLYKDGVLSKDLTLEENIQSLWRKASVPSDMYCLCGAVEDSAVFKLKIDQIKHALFAGKTRSGKSQFLMAFIAYLMVNYPPSFVQFLFIDFKGAALSTNFSHTPHCAGAFSDLDKGDASQIVRLREMLNAEIKRRESIIKNANISVNDMEHYNLAVKQSGSRNFMPHLFVIVDEYVELLSQHDEFIKDFERFSRVGASNGIHLFLASQRLDDKVSGQIKTNIDVSICFKVNTADESTSVVNCAGAESIMHRGRGFIRTENEVREFQAPWVQKDYTPYNYENRKGIYTVYLDGKRGQLGQETAGNHGEKTELNIICETLGKFDSGTQQKVFSEELGTQEYWTKSYLDWFESNRSTKSIMTVPFGVSDDFYSHRHSVASIRLSNNHYFIAGSSKRGKTTFLQSVIYSAGMLYDPKHLNIYVCDMGSKDFKPFTAFPQVHSTVIDNIEQFFRLLFHLERTVSERKRKFGDDYSSVEEYRNSRPDETMPEIVVMIDDIDNLIEDYEVVSEKIENLIVNSCDRYGITFIVTAKRYADIRRFSRMFDNKISFFLSGNMAEDLMETTQAVTLQDIPGRCYFSNNGRVLITQVYAFPKTAGKTVKETIEGIIAQSIDRLPKEWHENKPFEIVRRVESFSISNVSKMLYSKTAIIPVFIDNTDNALVFLDSKSLNSFFVLGEYRSTGQYLNVLINALQESNVHTYVIDLSDELNLLDKKNERLWVYDFESLPSFLSEFESNSLSGVPQVIVTVGLTEIYESLTCVKQGVLDDISALLSRIYTTGGRNNLFWIASDSLQNIHFDMFSQPTFTIEMMDCGMAFKKSPRFIEINSVRDFSPYKPALIDIEYNNRELPNNQAWFGYRGTYRRVVLPNDN